jgi:hypothetical protein
MAYEESHLSDEDLVLAADGELSGRRARRIEAHLAACWSCRARRQEIEAAIGEFVRCRERSLEAQLPPPGVPRALLKARLAELAVTSVRPRPARWWAPRLAVAGASAVLVVAVVAGWLGGSRGRDLASVVLPDTRLTPGAARTASRDEVCGGGYGRNGIVPQPLERKVLAAYGIRKPEPRAYEVDYLISPELGGSEDIRNLWPQSYKSAVWNARVKDALEDRLHEMVCRGDLDLTAAQREIASNWIAAYKKYFHTDSPLER